MVNTRTFFRSFAGGEIGPEMFGRIDDAVFQAGARELRNFIAKPQGPVFRRPGTQLVREVKNSAKKVKLLPFTFNSSQTYIIEAGEGYFRFHTQGATLLYTTPLAAYVGPANFSSVNTTTDEITTAEHGFATGDPIYFYVTGGSLAGGLSAATRYYAVVTSSTTFKVAETAAAALAGTPLVDLTTAGSGSQTAAKAYDPGDLVSYLGSNVYCNVSTFGVAPAPAPSDVAYWYVMPSSPNIYEIPSPFLEADLFELTTSGSNDVLSFAHRNRGKFDLQRLGAEKWTFAGVTTGPTLAAPTNVAATVTEGVKFGIGQATKGDGTALATGDQVAFTTDTAHGLLVGEGIVLRESAVGGARYMVEGRYRVADTDTGSLQRVILGGVDGSQLQARFATVTITNASPGVVTWNSHGFLSDHPVMFTTTGGLPAPLAQLVTYYVRNPLTNTFEVSATPGGASIATVSAGSGTHTGRSARAPFGGGPFNAYAITIVPAALSSENTNNYRITALDGNGNESDPSAIVAADNNLFADGSYNTLTWTSVAGAARYRIYKELTGLYGFIGETDTTTFKDDNIGPDLSRTIPIRDTSLDAATAYPQAVGRFEQRRVYAGTNADPQRVWATRSGTEKDLSFHIPVQDSDRLNFQIAAREASAIRHIVPMQHLLLLTSSTEVRVTPINSDALTPSSVSARNQSFVGSSYVQPLVVNGQVIFFAARGGHVREMGFDAASDGYITGDMSLRAAHLFDGLEVTDAAFQRAPLPILWAVSNNGKLLGCTYVPEQSVGAWHQHDTGGGDLFESVAVVAEGTEDRVYVVVKRGSSRFVERMAPMAVASLNSSFYVDCGLSYSGAPATVFSGLSHLNGRTVSILADGVVRTGTVASGQITLPVAASAVQIGLPITSRIVTLPLAMQIDGWAQGRPKNISKVWLRCYQSRPLRAGPSDTQLVTVFSGAGLLTSSEQVTVPGSWGDDGSLTIVQSDPVPTTVVGLTLETAIGG